MNPILNQLFVKAFYKKNAGFFMFLFLAFFGTMSAHDVVELHHSLMINITSSFTGLIVFSLVSIAYGVKCLFFMVGQAEKTEHIFIKNLRLVENKKQMLLFIACTFFVYFPMLFYSGLTIGVGISLKHFGVSILIASTQLLLILAIAYSIWKNINVLGVEKTYFRPFVIKSKPRNAYLFTISYLWNSKRTNLVAIKLFSFLLFQFLILLNTDNVSKENFSFVVLLSVSSHALLPFFIIRFWEEEFPYVRQFPISHLKRISYWLLTYVALFLPELIFMLVNNPDHVSPLILSSFYVLAVVHLLFFTSLQYLPRVNFNNYTGIILVQFFVSMFLMAGINVWLYALAEGAIALMLYVYFYPRYELQQEETIKG